MLAAIAQLLGAWALLALAFSGLGLAATRLLRFPGELSLTRTFWLGWAAILALLQPWCLLLPVDSRAEAFVGLTSLAGWIWCARERSAWWKRALHEAIWLVSTLLAAIWLADRALLPPQNGDTFLYHWPAVRWAEAYPAVPGLGNLHGRLAFNNSSTLYLALLDHGPFADRGFHLAHGLLVLPLFARGFRALVELLRGRGASARTVVDALLLAAAVDLALGPNLSSASPDLPVYVLEAVIASELVGWLESQAPAAEISALALLSVTLLTIKLSALGFVVGTALAVLLIRPRLPRVTAVIALVLLVPWVVRGIVLSGYPGYPSTLAGLPVDWRIPTAAAHAEADYVRAWGRHPGLPTEQVLANNDWIGPWFEAIWFLNREVVIPTLLGVLTTITALFGRRRTTLWLALLSPVLELAWWFVTSPDPRFAGASFWLLAAVGCALFVTAYDQPGSALRVGIGLLTAVLVVWPIAEAPAEAWVRASGLGPLPPSHQRPFQTDSGLVLAAPDEPGGCATGSLLCTPTPRKGLRLRVPGAPERGFKAGP